MPNTDKFKPRRIPARVMKSISSVERFFFDIRQTGNFRSYTTEETTPPLVQDMINKTRADLDIISKWNEASK